MSNKEDNTIEKDVYFIGVRKDHRLVKIYIKNKVVVKYVLSKEKIKPTDNNDKTIEWSDRNLSKHNQEITTILFLRKEITLLSLFPNYFYLNKNRQLYHHCNGIKILLSTIPFDNYCVKDEFVFILKIGDHWKDNKRYYSTSVFMFDIFNPSVYKKNNLPFLTRNEMKHITVTHDKIVLISSVGSVDFMEYPTRELKNVLFI